MADFEESYLVKGTALARIGRVTREVETNLGLKPPEHRRKRIPATILEGVFLERLAGTNDPNSPTTADFQIKTAVRATDGWEDEDSPSIVPVLNRTSTEYSEGSVGTVIELYPNKYFVISSGFKLIHGIVIAILTRGYYTVRLSDWSGTLPDTETEDTLCEILAGQVDVEGEAYTDCSVTQELPEFQETEDGSTPAIVKRQTTAQDPVVDVKAFHRQSIFVPLALWSEVTMIDAGDMIGDVKIYQIQDGFQQHVIAYDKEFECCELTGEWKLVQRTPYIFAAVKCGPDGCEPCPTE